MASPLFGFVQLEFGFLLGPGDGRYMVRDDPSVEPEVVLVLSTLAAPERRRRMRLLRARVASDDVHRWADGFLAELERSTARSHGVSSGT